MRRFFNEVRGAVLKLFLSEVCSAAARRFFREVRGASVTQFFKNSLTGTLQTGLFGEFGTHWNPFARYWEATGTRSEAISTPWEAIGTCLPPLPKLQVQCSKYVSNLRPPNLHLFRFFPFKFFIVTLLGVVARDGRHPYWHTASFAPSAFAAGCFTAVFFPFSFSPHRGQSLCRLYPHRPVGRSAGSMLNVDRWMLDLHPWKNGERSTSNLQLPTSNKSFPGATSALYPYPL